MDRRDFLKKTGILTVALALSPTILIAKEDSLVTRVRHEFLTRIGFKKVFSPGPARVCEVWDMYQGMEGNLTIAKYREGYEIKHSHLAKFPWSANFYKWGNYHWPRWRCNAIDEEALLDAIIRDSKYEFAHLSELV